MLSHPTPQPPPREPDHFSLPGERLVTPLVRRSLTFFAGVSINSTFPKQGCRCGENRHPLAQGKCGRNGDAGGATSQSLSAPPIPGAGFSPRCRCANSAGKVPARETSRPVAEMPVWQLASCRLSACREFPQQPAAILRPIQPEHLQPAIAFAVGDLRERLDPTKASSAPFISSLVNGPQLIFLYL